MAIADESNPFNASERAPLWSVVDCDVNERTWSARSRTKVHSFSLSLSLSLGREGGRERGALLKIEALISQIKSTRVANVQVQSFVMVMVKFGVNFGQNMPIFTVM